MSKELDRGLLLVRNLDVYETALGDPEAITLARRWKSLDPDIRERARDWSKPVIEELSRMTRREQLRCIAEYDDGEFKSVEGAVLGEDTEERDASGVEVVLSPAMKATLEASYRHIRELRELSGVVDDYYKREAIGFQLTRIENAFEAWSKTPKEMLHVPG